MSCMWYAVCLDVIFEVKHTCMLCSTQVLMWNRFQSSFSVKIVPLSAFCTVLRSMTELRPKKWWWFTRCYKYKAMNRKIRTEHGVQVPQHLVAFMQAHLDLEGVETRSVKKKRKKAKKPCTSPRSIWLHGHLFPKSVVFVRVLSTIFVRNWDLPTYLRNDGGTDADLELEQFKFRTRCGLIFWRWRLWLKKKNSIAGLSVMPHQYLSWVNNVR